MLMFATDGLTLIYPTSATPASSSHLPWCKHCSSTELLQSQFLFTSPPLPGDKQIWGGRQQL